MISEKHEVESEKDISVILAIRSEEGYIRKCLDSLINQNFAHERYEIVVIDGMSDDKTREIVAEYQVKFPQLIKTFDNHKRNPAAGRNVGIKHAGGKLVVIFSGHAYAPAEYLDTLIKTFDNVPSDVAGIGSILFAPDDETVFGKIMDDVQDTILGGAGTGWKKLTKSAYVDSITMAGYRKNIIEKVGLFDDKFLYSEDIELNFRIRKSGFRLMTSHEAKVYYYRKHSSLKLMLSKIYKYATWRAFCNKKHPGSLKMVFLAPVTLLLSVFLLPAFIFLYFPLAELVLFGLAIYFVTILTSALYFVAKHRDAKYLISIPVYLIEHFGFGAGFLIGLFQRIPKREQPE
jgi:GT2 family glycosyltransferase